MRRFVLQGSILLAWTIQMVSLSSPEPTSETPLVPEKLRICLLVEPSPLTYVCGYTNRFQSLLKNLTNDKVEMVTVEVVHENPPNQWRGIPVNYCRGVRLPNYPLMSISLDWTFKALRVIHRFKPDLIHVSSPGLMVFTCLLASRLFAIPLVISYHTHLPVYVRTYVRSRVLSRVTEWMGE